jgi:hypothetical protein
LSIVRFDDVKVFAEAFLYHLRIAPILGVHDPQGIHNSLRWKMTL